MENKLDTNKSEDDNNWGIQPYIDCNPHYEINGSSTICSQQTDNIEILHNKIEIQIPCFNRELEKED